MLMIPMFRRHGTSTRMTHDFDRTIADRGHSTRKRKRRRSRRRREVHDGTFDMSMIVNKYITSLLTKKNNIESQLAELSKLQ